MNLAPDYLGPYIPGTGPVEDWSTVSGVCLSARQLSVLISVDDPWFPHWWGTDTIPFVEYRCPDCFCITPLAEIENSTHLCARCRRDPGAWGTSRIKRKATL